MSWPVSQSFPVEALGPLLGTAVWQHQKNTSLAMDLIAPLALGCAASLVQGHNYVQRPNMPPSSTSLFATVIAGSGEGKDAAVEPFARPFGMFQNAAEEDTREANSTYTA